MIKIALWCVQYRPELRPIMSVVVKMLEGSLEVPEPGNPFQHLMGAVTFAHPVQDSQTYNTTTTSSGSFVMVTNSSIICATPIMRKYEIELASRNVWWRKYATWWIKLKNIFLCIQIYPFHAHINFLVIKIPFFLPLNHLKLTTLYNEWRKELNIVHESAT